LIVFLTLLVTCAALCDYLIGSKGRRKLKDRLADLYVATADTDWSELLRAPPQFFGGYLDWVLGPRYLSLRSVRQRNQRGKSGPATASPGTHSYAWGIQQASQAATIDKFLPSVNYLTPSPPIPELTY
jgi:hypothetical protein